MSDTVKSAPAHSTPERVVPRVFAPTATHSPMYMTHSDDHGYFSSFPPDLSLPWKYKHWTHPYMPNLTHAKKPLSVPNANTKSKAKLRIGFQPLH